MCYISSYFAIYGVQEIAWGREQEVCLKYIETRIVRLSVVQILLVGTALQIMLSWYLERKVQWMLKMLDQFRLCNSTVLCTRSEHTTLSYQHQHQLKRLSLDLVKHAMEGWRTTRHRVQNTVKRKSCQLIYFSLF